MTTPEQSARSKVREYILDHGGYDGDIWMSDLDDLLDAYGKAMREAGRLEGAKLMKEAIATYYGEMDDQAVRAAHDVEADVRTLFDADVILAEHDDVRKLANDRIYADGREHFGISASYATGPLHWLHDYVYDDDGCLNVSIGWLGERFIETLYAQKTGKMSELVEEWREKGFIDE